MESRLDASAPGAIEALGHRRRVVHAEHHAPAARRRGRRPTSARARAGRRARRARRAASAARSASVRPGASRRRGTAWWVSPAPCRKRTSPLRTASPSACAMPCMRSLSNVLGRGLRVGRRVDDPERGRRRVLGRARRVGVQGVALVEQRAQELLERGIHVSPPPAGRRRRRRRTAARARRAGARARRWCRRAGAPRRRWGSSAPSSRARWRRACASPPSRSTG